MLHFGDQGMEATRLRSQLTELATRLKKVVDRIAPVNAEEKARERRHVFASVERGVKEEHEEVFKRKNGSFALILSFVFLFLSSEVQTSTTRPYCVFVCVCNRDRES